jgi:hypothetical protein
MSAWQALGLGQGGVQGRQGRCLWPASRTIGAPSYRLSDEYVTTATADVAAQLSKARCAIGIRPRSFRSAGLGAVIAISLVVMSVMVAMPACLGARLRRNVPQFRGVGRAIAHRKRR